MSYEMVEHTGDLAVRLRAPDLAGLIASGVEALRALLFEGEPAPGAPVERGEASVSGIDREDVLVQALAEALHLLQSRPLYPQAIEVESASPKQARLRLAGVRARPAEEIKAVTYHAVSIQDREGELETLVVFDV